MKHSYLQRKGNILEVLGMNMRLTIFFMLRLKQASFWTLPVKIGRRKSRDFSMWEDGKWYTDVEIRAFASMLNTNVCVYCTYGTEQNCSWNKYTPINSASESSMYILHWNDHYEPVLDVEDCEIHDLFSRPPYLPICKYVPENTGNMSLPKHSKLHLSTTIMMKKYFKK
ncbi:hypothetical protein CHS0354_019824 [Potamilus streckersoni]|uniref:Uncharacterized protein n=1 Tax=Potamilus streckersoni TaxID=2493646 RepID=A0AAE0TFJ6_9BIVA|nr:hypothetical protein CHS0354_019824 [Potamilus streckersoni]